MIKFRKDMSFTEVFVTQRMVKRVFFEQINQIINWQQVEDEIKKYYTKGESVDGRPSYSGLVLFKISLLQYWYGLSDYEVEAQVKDSISFSYFTGIGFEDSVPDHSVISRFRTALSKQNAWDKILNHINFQLAQKNILVKCGKIIDASITDTPRKPKGTKGYIVHEDRKEDEKEQKLDDENNKLVLFKQKEVEPQPTLQVVYANDSTIDKEGAWIRKSGRLRYGFKKHVVTNSEDGLILNVDTTSAGVSDTKHFKIMMEKCVFEIGERVYADKGYDSASNRKCLADKKVKSGIMHRKPKGKTMAESMQKANRLISKTRYKIERTFGSIKLFAKTGLARYVGIERTHGQHVLESIAYNLYRSPKIAMKQIIQNQLCLIG